jgi:hypothetical protein
MKTTKVIFRKWRDTGDIIAMFPEIPADNTGRQCISYEHVGQHGGADPDCVQRQTVLAKPAEYRELMKELHQIGYRKLAPYRRFQASDMKARQLHPANIH